MPSLPLLRVVVVWLWLVDAPPDWDRRPIEAVIEQDLGPVLASTIPGRAPDSYIHPSALRVASAPCCSASLGWATIRSCQSAGA